PLRDPRAPRDPCCVESILQKQRRIELFRLKSRHKPLAPSNPCVLPLAIVDNQFVCNALPLVNLPHIRHGQNRHVRVHKPFAHRFQRRQRHNRVAHPIRRSNQQSHELFPRRSFKIRSSAGTNSHSELKTSSMTATYTGICSIPASSKFCSSFSV